MNYLHTTFFEANNNPIGFSVQFSDCRPGKDVRGSNLHGAWEELAKVTAQELCIEMETRYIETGIAVAMRSQAEAQGLLTAMSVEWPQVALDSQCLALSFIVDTTGGLILSTAYPKQVMERKTKALDILSSISTNNDGAGADPEVANDLDPEVPGVN